MALTRGSTGNSKPRIIEAISTSPATARKPRAKKTGSATKPKANTGKKRTGVTSGRVAKPKTATKKKATPKDKVEGAIEKAKGAVEGKPSKKAAGTKQMKGTKPKKAAVVPAA